MKFIFIFSLFLLIKISNAEDKGPIEIIAETMEWNKEEGKALAIGNAQAIQGNIVIKADKIIAVLDDVDRKKINKLLANGNIHFFKDEQQATGNEAIYNIDSDNIVIMGNVKLSRDKNVMIFQVKNPKTGLSSE